MNSKAKCFPVRPKPFDDEWFLGYVLRVAAGNGRGGLNELCRTLGMANRKGNYVVAHPQNTSFVEVLAGYLKRQPQVVTESFNQSQLQWLHDESRLVRDISVASPKVCPHCIVETGYFKTEWQYAHVTHCTKHAMMLLDRCPCCQAEFKWDSKLFSQCPSCKVAWENVELTHSSVPSYQDVYETAYTADNLRALYATLLFTLRPNDLMFDTLQTIQIGNEALHCHLLQAHALLTDSDYRQAWFETHPICNTFTPMYDDIQLDAYLERLAETYSNYAEKAGLHTVPIEKVELQSVVRKPRLPLAEKPEDLNFQLGLNEAAGFLGLSGSEVFELVEAGVLAALNAPRTLRDLLFDVRTLDGLSQLILERAGSVDADCKDLVPLRDLFGKLKYFGMNKARLISTLLQTPSISLYSDSHAGDWQTIPVHRTALLSLLDEEFASQLPETISAKAFRVMCGLNESQLQTLVSQTDLHYAGWHETDQIKVDVAQSFFNDYLLLNRIAKLYSYDLKLTYERLTDLGLEPVFELSDKKPVIVYSKKIITQATLFAICVMPLQSKSNATLQENSLPRNQNLNQ